MGVNQNAKMLGVLVEHITQFHSFSTEALQWVIENPKVAISLLKAEVNKQLSVSHPIAEAVKDNTRRDHEIWRRAIDHSKIYQHLLGLSDEDLKGMVARDEVVHVNCGKFDGYIISKNTCGPAESGWINLLQARGFSTSSLVRGCGTGLTVIPEEKDFSEIILALCDNNNLRLVTKRMWP